MPIIKAKRNNNGQGDKMKNVKDIEWVTMTIRFPVNVGQALRKRAEADRRGMSSMAAIIIEDALKGA